MQEHQLAVVINPVNTTGAEALSQKWGISPTAVARRALRELLEKHDLYHPRRRPTKTPKPAKPVKGHRTIRVTPHQEGIVDRIADRYHVSRSKTVRALISHANRYPITHEHLDRVPAHKRKVRWSVRLDRQQDEAVMKVAELLRCSLTDATAALLASDEGQRSLLHQLGQHPPNTTAPTTDPHAGEQDHNTSREIIPPEDMMGTNSHQPKVVHNEQQSLLPL